MKFEFSDGKAMAFSFLLGFIVRMVPEVLAFPYPIGYDTVYYAVRLKSGIVWQHWSSFFTSSWLFYALTVPLYSVFDGDPFLFLKVVVPALYGLNVAGIYWFARKMLGWDFRYSLFACVFFSLQLASLRISWDLLRNTLGMGLLLFAIPCIKRLNSKGGVACFVLLSLLTVFAHEYAAVALLAVVLGLLFWCVIGKEVNANGKRLFLAFFPALTFFLIGVGLRIFPIHYTVETNVLCAEDVKLSGVGGLFFLVNYFNVTTPIDYSSYFDLVWKVFVLFALLYFPYLFLVLKGFFRHDALDIWTSLLLVGSFVCLVFPFYALQSWHRWMFMLVFPFTFYAINGLKKFSSWKCESSAFRSIRNFRFTERKVKGMFLLTVVLGGFYLLSPVMMVYFGGNVSSFPPVGYYFSSAPTVPYEDVDGVVQAIKWLNKNMDNGSCVVLQHALLSWGRLYLDKSYTIVAFLNSVESAVDAALKHGFNHVLFVWWNQPIGWYPVAVPKYFISIRDFGRISVFVFSNV